MVISQTDRAKLWLALDVIEEVLGKVETRRDMASDRLTRVLARPYSNPYEIATVTKKFEACESLAKSLAASREALRAVTESDPQPDEEIEDAFSLAR